MPQRNPVIEHDRDADKARNAVERFFNNPPGDAGIAWRAMTSNISAPWPRAMTNVTTTTSPQSNSLQSGFGCELMSR